MHRTISRTWMTLAFLALGPGWICAQSIPFSVLLDGPSESPPNASPGTGSAIIRFDLTAHTMSIDVTFSGLVGTTTASHIHAATAIPFSGTAGVATQLPSFVGFPLGVTSGSYQNTFDMTQAASYNPTFITNNGGTPASAEAALFAAAESGRAYLNIHSNVFPGGEIRGFLAAVPEPSTVVLSVLGVTGVATCAWAQRRCRRRWRSSPTA